MRRWLKGFVFVCIIVFIIGGSACGRKTGNEVVNTDVPITPTGSPSDSYPGESQNPASENGTAAGNKPSTPYKTDEPLAADEMQYAEMDQSTLVKTIDQSLMSVISQSQSFFELIDKSYASKPFTIEELSTITIKIDLVKEVIYQAEEQMEVYFYLYGKEQNDFISFLNIVDEDLDAELFKIVAISDLIRNNDVVTEEMSESIFDTVTDMKNQFENLKINQEKFIAAYEMSADQK